MVKFLRMTLFALLFSITFGVSSLAFGYHLAGFTLFVRWILFFGAAWLVAVWQRWNWFAYIGVAFNLLVAALGLWLLNFSPGWMFAGAIGGLLAFDLTFFWQRVRFIRLRRGAARTRVRVICSESVCLPSLLRRLQSLAMLVKRQFTFEWGIVWIMILVLGPILIIYWLRNRS